MPRPLSAPMFDPFVVGSFALGCVFTLGFWVGLNWNEIAEGPAVLPEEKVHRSIYYSPPPTVEEELKAQVEKSKELP